MPKPSNLDSQLSELAQPTPQIPYTADIISVDCGNGVVVVTTNAPDGTGFTAKIDGVQLDANVEAGQVWFYVGRPLRPSPIVELM